MTITNAGNDDLFMGKAALMVYTSQSLPLPLFFLAFISSFLTLSFSHR
jgi:hypothetical protein